MVPGLDSFREKFKNYTDYYTIIGGTACDILPQRQTCCSRATKDIDMILIMEDNFPKICEHILGIHKKKAAISADGRMNRICTFTASQKANSVILL